MAHFLTSWPWGGYRQNKLSKKVLQDNLSVEKCVHLCQQLRAEFSWACCFRGENPVFTRKLSPQRSVNRVAAVARISRSLLSAQMASVVLVANASHSRPSRLTSSLILIRNAICTGAFCKCRGKQINISFFGCQLQQKWFCASDEMQIQWCHHSTVQGKMLLSMGHDKTQL